MAGSLVILPIEIKSRELEARLLTAAYLLEQGKEIVLGQQWSIFSNVGNWPKSHILFKTVNAIQGNAMALFKKHGHKVFALDDEILVFTENYTQAFSKIAADNCDVFFAQDSEHLHGVEQVYPNLKQVVTGNPRSEIAWDAKELYKDQADKVRKEHGKFTLINTNFSGVNGIWGGPEATMTLWKNAGLVYNEATYNQLVDALKWEQENLKQLFKYIYMHQVRFGQKLIVRPHPSEKIDIYDAIKQDNTLVVYGEDPNVYALAADLIVHTSCTTGYEAYIMGKPVINIVPRVCPMGAQITDVVNDVAIDADSAIDLTEVCYAKGLTSAHLVSKPFASASAIANWLAYEIVPRQDAFSFEESVRTDIQKNKITLTMDEMRTILDRIKKDKGLKFNCDVTALDDSLFLLTPE